MKRKFDTYTVDELYLDNLIGTAINELRNMRDLKGKLVHKYHNLSKVKNHLDKYHNIKLDNHRSTSLNLDETKVARASYQLFKTVYTKKASKYKKARGNNYTFYPLENKYIILLRSVENLFRVT